jgi:M6 family metalloprotease-like protein
MNKKENDVTRFKLLFPVILIFLSGIAFAKPHNGEVFSLIQPDGTYVDCKVFGDEFYQDVETPDGFTLIRDPSTGWICYAKLASDGASYVSSGIVYDPSNENPAKQFKSSHSKNVRISREARERAAKHNRDILFQPLASDGIQTSGLIGIQSAPPSVTKMTGTYTGLTILVDFPDKHGSVAKSEIDNFCNQVGYTNYSNNGSVRDYFSAISDGAITYMNKVTDYITATNNFSYYDQNCDYCTVTELLTDVFTKLKNSGFDVSGVTTSNSQFTAVNVLYAGAPTQGWAKGLWPHSSSFRGSVSINGIKFVRYQLTNIGTEMAIDTFTHENGHMLLGWPDVYAYDDHDNGVGYYEEGSNQKNPALRNPYFRFLKGWGLVTDISNAAPGTIFSLSANSNQMCYYSNRTDGKEFFFIEVKRRSGRNASIPDEGLAIWHVNTAGDNTVSSKPNLISIEQADGANHIENRTNNGGSGDLWHSGDKTTFNDNTNPTAKWMDGTVSAIDINSVSAIGDTMTFMFKTGTPITPEPTSVPTAVPTIGPTPVPGTIAIACGGSSAVGSFQADQYYSGGSTYNNTNTIDVSQITTDTPPAALFNNERYGAMSYTIPGFTAEGTYAVTLYFAETYLTSSGGRVFNVSINGAAALSNFDIYASAGAQNKAIAKSLTATANSSGQIVIQFTSVTENPKINGISINPGSNNGAIGDVNGSGSIDIVDALLIAQYYVGLNPANFSAASADVNCTGSIDIVDALLVAQLYVGLIGNFPC